MRDQLSICNGALDELPATAIQSINDPDDEGALACRRNYANVFEDLIDHHPYDAAIRREVGAVTTNAREGEWLFCYQYPTEARTILRVLPNYAATYSVSSAPILAGQMVAPLVGYFPQDVGVPYVVAAGKIYTNLEFAVIEFIAANPDLSLFSPLFHRSFELALAARICMPVIKSRSRKKELQADAELWEGRAMADDLNNSPKRWDAFPSEEALVRNDMLGDPSYGGWYR